MKTLHATLKEAQCFCKSYYDDNNQLRDCTCGTCEAKSLTHTTTEYIEGKLAKFDSQFIGLEEKGMLINWLRSFAHDLVAETRQEARLLGYQAGQKATLKEIEGIIGKDDDSNGKEGSAIWAGARNNLRHDILSVLKKKGKV